MNEQQDNPVIIQDGRKQPEPAAQKKHPVKGRYLKPTSPPARRRRRRRRKLNPRFVVLMAILLAILITIVFCIRSCGSKSTIVGRWDLDETTVYEFREDGKGALILMNAEYEFHYAIEENIVHIDFVDEGCLDADYTFALEDNLLFWTGGHGDAKNDFVLKRIG